MAVWGLIFSAIGAGLVAFGQNDIARSAALWLNALELEKLSSNSGGDIIHVLGADEHMERSIKRNKKLAPWGWGIFILGIVMQTVPYFQQLGWKALSVF